MAGTYSDPAEVLDLSPVVSDEIKYTTCDMCAGRCGIKVHLLDGGIRFIEGNRDHPVNKGVLCAKGAAGIMQQNSPARLTKPLLRTGERGVGEFREIEWDEALTLAADWLGDIRKTDPRRLAFFTGRDQSEALTGWWAAQFGTPNYAAHGGFCSVNMAAAGLYTIGGSFWESGEPDWDLTRYFLMFGVAEDHDSNPMKTGIAKLKQRGAKFVSVNPVRTGYSAVADEWIGIRPGTDGLFVLALVHELLKANRIDLEFIVRYTNLPWLVISDDGAPDDGLFARGPEGEPLCWDKTTAQVADARLAGVTPAVVGEFTLADGRRAQPAFALMARRYLDTAYSPETAAARTGISAATIRRLAAEIADVAFRQEVVVEVPWTDWAGRRHERMIGRPVALHAMRGISAHSNGFHTCRALHLLQTLLGAIDCPGGFRYRPPFPKPAPPMGRPAGRTDQVAPGTELPGPPLGFPTGPEDLLVDGDGTPQRIDKAFSWDAPLAAHGMIQMVIHNAWKGDPYPIDTLFLYMANMSWNSAMNTVGTMAMLTDRGGADGAYKIPRIIYSDAFYSEMVPYADLVLPDTTYLERWDCISLLDHPISSADGPADAIRQPVVAVDRDVRPFQDVLLELGVRLGLPGMVRDDGAAKYPGGYADYMANFEHAPGIGMLAGWRGAGGDRHGSGPANPDQLARYIENQCFWQHELAPEQRYFKHANRDYLEYAAAAGFIPTADQIILQIYCEPLQRFRLAARGHGDVVPPQSDRARIETYFDPLPFWYPPFAQSADEDEAFPLHAVTQRPAAMYQSWGGHNAWLRQIHGTNPLYINRRTAESLSIEDGDWVWAISHHGRIKARAKLMEGVNPNTVWTWNAIGKRAGAWNLAPDSPEAKTGFLVNHLISELLPPREDGHRYANADPVTGQAAWYDLRVRIEKAGTADAAEVAPEVAAEAEAEAGQSEPQFAPLPVPPGLAERPDILRYGRKYSRNSRDAGHNAGRGDKRGDDT